MRNQLKSSGKRPNELELLVQDYRMEAILRRGFLVPWIFSAVVMLGLHYVWHGLILTDMQELSLPIGLYLLIASVVYATIGFVLTLILDQCLLHGIIKLKAGFPFLAFLIAGIVGFLLYLLVFVLAGVSFSDNGAQHVVIDIIWQIVEQGLGGLCIALGIIYDVRRIQIEMEGG